MKATLKDIATAAGVSESTVSRALAGNQAIAEDTRARVAVIAERLGYVRPARAGRTGGTDGRCLVGLVVAALHNSFYSALVARIHDELDALGCDMILIMDDLSATGSGRKILGLIDTSLDGIIFATASIGSPIVDQLVAQGFPTVLAIRSNKRGNVDVVESDNLMAGEEATRHLIDLGHRRIGFLLGPRSTSTAVDRYQGCLRALNAAGLPVEGHPVFWGDFSHDSGYSGLVNLMNLPDPPTAVFCANDVIAIGALDACEKLGVRVPADLSVMGVDDVPMASWSMISLTTVRQSIERIGTLAAQRIVARIRGQADPSPVNDILPTSVITRRTTGAARSP